MTIILPTWLLVTAAIMVGLPAAIVVIAFGVLGLVFAMTKSGGAWR